MQENNGRRSLFRVKVRRGPVRTVFLTNDGFEIAGMKGDTLVLHLGHPLVLGNASHISEEAAGFIGRLKFQSEPVQKVLFSKSRPKRNRR